ncbi:glycosyl transferase family 1 [Xanthobacter autotrophicus]|uniref:glycosyltransferase n=1 Tax=Xanthobacter TaxID=279 RepID=UPI0024AC115E|nr:nucleotide disphospho-sugar-binding domain-containing protein [Xanthobacter autotrophicus]MDI4664960.1 glycosyl transferase family 1 [Xanthobacter autotrophicus]
MKPHILLMGEAVTLTHVVRPTLLADALHAAGYGVTLACDPRFGALIGPRPYRTIALKSAIDPAASTALLKQNQPLFSVETFNAYVREDVRLMRLVQPQLVVGDMRQSLAISAQLARVPYVNIINAHWSPWSDEPFVLVDHPLYKVLGRETGDRLLALMTPLGSMMMALPINIAALNNGLAPIGAGLRETFCAGDYVVYPDIPELSPTRPLPPNHRHIGPLDFSPQIAPPMWWDAVPEDKPIIYVNLGSSGEPALLEAILAGLSDLPVTVIAATARPGAVLEVPANAFVADYLPGDAAAARAALVICNGGASSGCQALMAGTPFLGIPSNTDQLSYGRMVAKTGAAENLREDEVTRDSVRTTVAGMLAAPGYREAARRLQQDLARYDAKANFVAFVGEILAASSGAVSSEAGTGSREENASTQDSGAASAS